MKDIWSELGLQFKKLYREYREPLRADWFSTPWNERGDHWHLAFNPRMHFPEQEKEVLKGRFTDLAERAAAYLEHRDRATALFAWLDLLKQRSPHFGVVGSSMQCADDRQEEYKIGEIRKLFQASAECCFKMRTDRSFSEVAVEPTVVVLHEAGVSRRRLLSERDLAVVNRRMIIEQVLGESETSPPAMKICQGFDKVDLKVPADWRAKFGVGLWKDACKHRRLKNRVQAMISKDIRRIQGRK